MTTQTRQNSTNIDWGEYDNDGWCPGCDFCRDCKCAHHISTYHNCNDELEGLYRLVSKGTYLTLKPVTGE